MSKELIDRLKSYIPSGDGHNSQYANDLADAVVILEAKAAPAGEREAFEAKYPAAKKLDFRGGVYLNRLGSELPRSVRDGINDAWVDFQAGAAYQRAQQPQSEYGDAYQGAREDLAIWKRRALEAEVRIREQDQIIENLGNALNAESGPTFMGEPVIQQPQNAEAVAWTWQGALDQLKGYCPEGVAVFGRKGQGVPIPLYTTPQPSAVPEVGRLVPPETDAGGINPRYEGCYEGESKEQSAMRRAAYCLSASGRHYVSNREMIKISQELYTLLAATPQPATVQGVNAQLLEEFEREKTIRHALEAAHSAIVYQGESTPFRYALEQLTKALSLTMPKEAKGE